MGIREIVSVRTVSTPTVKAEHNDAGGSRQSLFLELKTLTFAGAVTTGTVVVGLASHRLHWSAVPAAAVYAGLVGIVLISSGLRDPQNKAPAVSQIIVGVINTFVLWGSILGFVALTNEGDIAFS